MHSLLMVLISLLCFTDAGLWFWHDNVASMWAFIGFGIGYVGLAFVFGGM